LMPSLEIGFFECYGRDRLPFFISSAVEATQGRRVLSQRDSLVPASFSQSARHAPNA
jgi:hypothetical protein